MNFRFSFRCTMALLLLGLSSSLSSAETIIDQFQYFTDPWTEKEGKTVDKSYMALKSYKDKLGQTLGRGEFYYQLILNNKFVQSDCGEVDDKRRLNTVTADIFRVSAAGKGTRVEDAKAVPLIAFGIGVDPVSGTKLGNSEACRVRPIQTQWWKLRRYGGEPIENYTVRLGFVSTHEKSSIFKKIVKSLADVPLIAGLIPTGYNTFTKELAGAVAESRQDKESKTDFRDLPPIQPLQIKGAIHRVVIQAARGTGNIEIYIRKHGSLILGSAITARDIITADLWEEDKGFLRKFREAATPRKDAGEDQKDERNGRAIQGTTEGVISTQSKEVAMEREITAFCTKVRDLAEIDLALSTIDALLMRRSMLIEYKYDRAVKNNRALTDACWPDKADDLINAVAPGIETFGIEK